MVLSQSGMDSCAILTTFSNVTLLTDPLIDPSWWEKLPTHHASYWPSVPGMNWVSHVNVWYRSCIDVYCIQLKSQRAHQAARSISSDCILMAPATASRLPSWLTHSQTPEQQRNGSAGISSSVLKSNSSPWNRNKYLRYRFLRNTEQIPPSNLGFRDSWCIYAGDKSCSHDAYMSHKFLLEWYVISDLNQSLFVTETRFVDLNKKKLYLLFAIG